MVFVAQRIASHLQNFTYLVGDPATRRALIVDPSLDATVALKLAEEHGYQVETILNTHEHWDHCSDNAVAKHRTDAKVMAHRLADVPEKDRSLEDGDILKVGEVKVRVYHTPGHSPGSVVYVAGKHSFTGDCLFVGNIGRYDLPGSDARAMHESLFHVVAKLPEDLVVNPGHDYGPAPTSTIGQELRTNPYLQRKAFEAWDALA